MYQNLDHLCKCKIVTLKFLVAQALVTASCAEIESNFAEGIL